VQDAQLYLRCFSLLACLFLVGAVHTHASFLTVPQVIAEARRIAEARKAAAALLRKASGAEATPSGTPRVSAKPASALNPPVATGTAPSAGKGLVSPRITRFYACLVMAWDSVFKQEAFISCRLGDDTQVLAKRASEFRGFASREAVCALSLCCCPRQWAAPGPADALPPPSPAAAHVCPGCAPGGRGGAGRARPSGQQDRQTTGEDAGRARGKAAPRNRPGVTPCLLAKPTGACQSPACPSWTGFYGEGKQKWLECWLNTLGSRAS
jgi:hypothetical protein